MKLPSQIQIEDSFREVERMIHKVVHKALKRYNLDPDDCLEAAFYGFMQAFETYTSDKGAFTTWVWNKSAKRILDLIRKRSEELKKPITNEIELDQILKINPKRFDVEEWLETLTPDAEYVANLVLKAPIEIRATLVQLGSQSSANWRMAIREMLKDQGWTDERVKKSFREVRERL